MSHLDDVEKHIDDYFDNISSKQLKEDLKKAGYSHYKNVKSPFEELADRIKELEQQLAYAKIMQEDIIERYERENVRLNECPWCGKEMERIPVDGGTELGCTNEKCPSFGVGVWCYADSLGRENARLREALEKIIKLKFDSFTDGRVKTLKIARQALKGGVVK